MKLPTIPDLLTTANLVCGVGSILLASQGQLTIACGLIFLAAVFDVFDGLAARALGGGTPLGAQLDSLADMVSFGVAPGIIVWHMSYQEALLVLYSDPLADHFGIQVGTNPIVLVGWLTAIIIVVGSAWRLAKFNIDTRQSHGFLGLPTPANALFWASVGIGRMQGDRVVASMANPYVIALIALALAVLMLSELPLPSLKIKHKGWKGNEVIFLLIGIGAVLVLLYGILAVPLILIIYLLSPLWGRIFHRNAETQSR